MPEREVYDTTGMTRLGVEEHVEVCGEDFCDNCGDCLVCYGGDPCPDGFHRSIRYLEPGEVWSGGGRTTMSARTNDFGPMGDGTETS